MSSVTGKVVSKPSTTIPTESPTRITSIPASCKSRAMLTSYAVRTAIFVPLAFIARKSGTRTCIMTVRVARSVCAGRRGHSAFRAFHDEHQRDLGNENNGEDPDYIDERDHRRLPLDHSKN